ncbi:hypothetical protein H1C71_024738 [Ictidomys tridecemlineatus]|nr:hypothetical protein H1C71_024738 [Ictidomys tridecemlineatus]
MINRPVVDRKPTSWVPITSGFLTPYLCGLMTCKQPRRFLKEEPSLVNVRNTHTSQRSAGACGQQGSRAPALVTLAVPGGPSGQFVSFWPLVGLDAEQHVAGGDWVAVLGPRLHRPSYLRPLLTLFRL